MMGMMFCDERTTDKCASCDVDLGSCRVIYAADGAMYCSIDCGEYDWEAAGLNPDDFSGAADDLIPSEIGIAIRECCNTCAAGGDGMCCVDGNQQAEQPIGGICELWTPYISS